VGWLFRDEIAAPSPVLFGERASRMVLPFRRRRTLQGFEARLASFLRDAVAKPALIIVAHGVVSRVLRGLYAGMPRKAALSLPVPQDSIFRLSGRQERT